MMKVFTSVPLFFVPSCFLIALTAIASIEIFRRIHQKSHGNGSNARACFRPLDGACLGWSIVALSQCVFALLLVRRMMQPVCFSPTADAIVYQRFAVAVVLETLLMGTVSFFQLKEFLRNHQVYAKQRNEEIRQRRSIARAEQGESAYH